LISKIAELGSDSIQALKDLTDRTIHVARGNLVSTGIENNIVILRSIEKID